MPFFPLVFFVDVLIDSDCFVAVLSLPFVFVDARKIIIKNKLYVWYGTFPFIKNKTNKNKNIK